LKASKLVEEHLEAATHCFGSVCVSTVFWKLLKSFRQLQENLEDFWTVSRVYWRFWTVFNAFGNS